MIHIFVFIQILNLKSLWEKEPPEVFLSYIWIPTLFFWVSIIIIIMLVIVILVKYLFQYFFEEIFELKLIYIFSLLEIISIAITSNIIQKILTLPLELKSQRSYEYYTNNKNQDFSKSYKKYKIYFPTGFKKNIDKNILLIISSLIYFLSFLFTLKKMKILK